MTILSLPGSPAFASSQFGLVSNTQTFISPLSGQSQSIERPGARWRADYTLPPMKRAQAAAWQALLLQLRGGAGRFYGYDPDARLYVGLLDEQHRLIGTPLLIYRGRMDTLDIEMGSTATLTLTVQSRLSDWERPRLLRYTNEQQQADWPGDKGFEFIAQMAEKTIYWGRT